MPNEQQQKYANSKQVAAFLKVTETDVKRFVRAGMPKEGHNKFNAIECVHWYIQKLRDEMEYGTVKDMALMINKTERYVNKLVAEKNFPREGHGRYNRLNFLHAYLNYKDELIKEAKAGGENSTEAKARLSTITADLRELEKLEKLKELIPKKLFLDLLLDLFARFGNTIDSFPGKKINKVYACKTKPEMLKVLKDAAREMREVLSTKEIEETLK